MKLIEPGTKVHLAGQTFFTDPVGAPGLDHDLLPWLTGIVGEALQLQGAEPDPYSTLLALGVNSMQAIALQYQILQRTGTDVAIDDLLGSRTITELAELIAKNVADHPAQTPDEVVV